MSQKPMPHIDLVASIGLLRKDYSLLLAKVQQLQEVLLKNGRHGEGCGAILRRDHSDPYWIEAHPCECGLDAALAPLEGWE